MKGFSQDLCERQDRSDCGYQNSAGGNILCATCFAIPVLCREIDRCLDSGVNEFRRQNQRNAKDDRKPLRSSQSDDARKLRNRDRAEPMNPKVAFTSAMVNTAERLSYCTGNAANRGGFHWRLHAAS